MFLVDTDVVSELRRHATGRADPRVVAWADAAPVAVQFVSAVTLTELEVGVLRTERRDLRQGPALRRWFDEDVLRAFAGRVLPVDEAVARGVAALHVPDPAPSHDALVAATALVHGLTVVTRHVADFVRFDGVGVLDPWAE